MAAYVALVSLMNTMDHVQNHSRHRLSLYITKQVESLCKNIDFLLDFIESTNNSHGGGSKEYEDLESQIASAAYAAEDVIESHVVDQVHAGWLSLLDLKTVVQDMDSVKDRVVNFKEKAQDQKSICSIPLLRGLDKVIAGVDSVNEKVVKVKEDSSSTNQQPTNSSASVTSSRSLTTDQKNAMVGFEDELIQLMDGLTGKKSSLQIIPIVGMGGIGKTTLAKTVYESSLILHHFDIRAWATISQQYSVGEIFSQFHSSQSKYTGEYNRQTDDQSAQQQLYQSLIGRRYLIILDDMWSIEAWDKIKFFFPDNNNGSRIVVTTRLLDVSTYFGSSRLAMSSLDEDKSWKLFCEKAFGQEGCPNELEGTGRKIVKKCKGLPLSIVVIGGLLAKSTKKQEHWEIIARDKSSITNYVDDDQSLDILSLSYSHLPAHLKPCFLYMGTFREDHVIRVSQLIKRWVAEGFIKPSKTRSFEEVAEGYFQNLIDMNLILVHRLGWNGKIRTCKVHDLVRDLCIMIAEKEKFICFMRVNVLGIPGGDMDRARRFAYQENISMHYHRANDALRSASQARSLLSFGWETDKLRLLRVFNTNSGISIETFSRNVNLRFVACDLTWMPDYIMFWSLSELWNLQTLIFSGRNEGVAAPSDIWVMPQLRHIEIHELILPDPSIYKGEDIVLGNLQTLTYVVNLNLNEEVCKRIPNVKKLHLRLRWERNGPNNYSIGDLGRLRKLETLKLNFEYKQGLDDLLRNLMFLSLLKKLTLNGIDLRWEDLTMIGSLPRLEVLKLRHYATGESEWSTVEGGFLRLKFLGIYYCDDLINWNSDSSHFPVLENLVLEDFPKLEEISWGIGEIPTLKLIRLADCNESAVISAMRMLEELESLGDEGLQIRVRFRFARDDESFKKKMELESFTSKYFHLES